METKADNDPGRVYWVLVNVGIAINITILIDIISWNYIDQIPTIFLFPFLLCFISPLAILLLFKLHSRI